LNLRTVFRARRAGEVLGKVRDVATALVLGGGRLTPLSVLGIVVHAAGLVVSLLSPNMRTVSQGWTRLTLTQELHRLVRSAIAPHTVHSDGEWLHAEIGDQGVLTDMQADSVSGSFYVERDAAALLAHVRESTWRASGNRARLAPFGRWCDSVDVLLSPEPPDVDSTAAREAWAKVAPFLAVGEPRGVLLDGVPRTGKSTIARRLAALREVQLGRPARVLRVAVSDFFLMSPSVVEEAAALLQPDVLLIDDVDRFPATDQLLGLFERVRAHCPLVVASSNDGAKLPIALRLPGRIDLVVEVKSAGPELARHVAGPLLWSALGEAQRGTVAGWPVRLVTELRMRRELYDGCDLATEIEELEVRAAAALRPAIASATPQDPAPAGTPLAPATLKTIA
jgi:hypothetical protein